MRRRPRLKHRAPRPHQDARRRLAARGCREAGLHTAPALPQLSRFPLPPHGRSDSSSRCPRRGPSRLDQTADRADDLLDRRTLRRCPRVQDIDVVEAHPTERRVHLGRRGLLRPKLPPKLVRNDHLVALPAGGPEQLAEDDLGVACPDRRRPRLVVVARVVEKRDAALLRRSHHSDPLCARDALVGTPGTEREHRHVDTRSPEGPARQWVHRKNLRPAQTRALYCRDGHALNDEPSHKSVSRRHGALLEPRGDGCQPPDGCGHTGFRTSSSRRWSRILAQADGAQKILEPLS